MEMQKVWGWMPPGLRRRASSLVEAASLMRQVESPRVVLGMLPSVGRGLLLEQGRLGPGVELLSTHVAHLCWSYDPDFAGLRALYRKAKESQWDSEQAIDWSRDVDPQSPERPLLPLGFFDVPGLERLGVKLDAKEQRAFTHSVAAWMISQFLHGEQAALLAAAQIVESLGWMDAKLFAATQVVDEARHVETFHRYLATKLTRLYVVNDNAFVIFDALLTDRRWDMKLLGMQIMGEGLALGAFGTLYRATREPLLRELLGYVIRDEARHVSFGIVTLRAYLAQLSERERREREDWCFEVALLMRNRFLAHEVYQEWFEGRISRRQWNALVDGSAGMREFRSQMFSRLVPTLRQIGLLSPRVHQHYERAGLSKYLEAAEQSTELSGDRVIEELQATQPDFA